MSSSIAARWISWPTSRCSAERSRSIEFEIGSFLEGIEDALQALDMIVFLPLTRGDEIGTYGGVSGTTPPR